MGTLKHVATAIAMAVLLAGCAGQDAIQDQLTFCDGAKPLRPAKGETASLSDSLVDQIHQHNALGVEVCQWTP